MISADLPSDVLVFTPLLRFEAETREAIFAMRWDGPISYLFQRDNPHGDPYEADPWDGRGVGIRNHLHQYQRGREVFLQGRYDAMLVVESDIVPPPNTLQDLAAMEVDLAYGCYLLKPHRIVNVFELYTQPASNIGESLSIWPGKWQEALKQGIVPCSGAGFGCVLIKRWVLERVEFRVEWPQNGAHCDSFFTQDVYKLGAKMAASTAVLCKHIGEDGTVYDFD